MNNIIEVKTDVSMVNEAAVREAYKKITEKLISNKLCITTMESCTSGQIASLITDTEGASEIMKGAAITYSNEAKIIEGVPAKIIDEYGVYSPETALSMAKSCRKKYGADIAIGVTGSFGNVDPANADSVPGKVYGAVIFGKNEEKITVIDISILGTGSRYMYKLAVAEVLAKYIM